MAKENAVSLAGIVQGTPRVTFSKPAGTYDHATLALKVIRRMRRGPDGAVRPDKDRFDYPLICAYDVSLIENEIPQIRAGDLVLVKGVITAQATPKTVTCAHCNAKNKLKDGVVTYITAIDLIKIAGPTDEPIETLHRWHEFSNDVSVIGTLCRDTKYYVMPSGTPSIQYQIAINRKFRIPDASQEEIRSDYIWVASFGSQADEDYKRLKKGSSIFIRGGVQTREADRRCICGKCKNEIAFKDSVAEIVPYSVEYLHNCMFDDIKAEEEEKSDNK